jgi:hypothetical protein
LDTARLVLDYVEALVWPGVVVLLALVLTWWFRREIGAVIGRMTLFRGPGGLEAHSPLPGAQTAPERGDGGGPKSEQIAEVVRQEAEEVGRRYEEYVRTLEARGQAVQQALADLYERFAATEFYWYCERVYRTIYGTQIMLLQHLRGRGVAGASVGELVPFFQQHVDAVRRENPAYEGEFDAYVSYLAASQLVMQDPSAPTRHRISPHGVGFLAYLPWAGIPPEKPW